MYGKQVNKKLINNKHFIANKGLSVIYFQLSLNGTAEID